MGKYSVSFFEKAGRRRPVFRPKGAFGARSLVNRRPAGPTIRVYPPFKSSFGIGAYPDNAPPLFNSSRDGLNNVKFSIFVRHNNKIALSVIKNYFGGHIVKEGTNHRRGAFGAERAASFAYGLSNKKALKKLINVLERAKLKTKTRIEFLKWAKIFRLIMESQTASTPLTKRNKKRIKDFFLLRGQKGSF